MTSGGGKKDLLWLRQVSSFAQSRIILTANNFRLFEHLQHNGMTAQGIARRLSLDPRAAELVLNSLAAIGLLRKKGALYSNSTAASQYLVEKSPLYQGDILRHYDGLWKSWSGLDSVLKTGKPNRSGRDIRSFILGMDNIAKLRAGRVIDSLDLRGVNRVLDLGGGPGTYSIAFCQKGLDVTLFDFPETLEISKEIIEKAKPGRKISLHPGDFVTDNIGKGYDLVFISQIFHAYSTAQCMQMLRKASRALNPGGKVVVQEFLLNDDMASPLQGALFAINMLVNTPAGRSYTPKEIGDWMRKTGFAKIKARVLDETVLVSGVRQKKGTVRTT